MILPGDADYDDVRKVWNGMINKRPALIVRCAGFSDVINSVNFARENNLLVAIRGDSHSAAGNASCDGGLVIDLSRMKGIRADPVKRTVHAQGARSGKIWTGGLKPLAWQLPGARSTLLASPGLRWVAAWAG